MSSSVIRSIIRSGSVSGSGRRSGGGRHSGGGSGSVIGSVSGSMRKIIIGSDSDSRSVSGGMIRSVSGSKKGIVSGRVSRSVSGSGSGIWPDIRRWRDRDGATPRWEEDSMGATGPVGLERQYGTWAWRVLKIN